MTDLQRRGAGNGVWASGHIGGYRFQALVFSEHADLPEYELNLDSYISKLWIQRSSDKEEVFHWDRGPDRAATDAKVAAVVERLARAACEDGVPRRIG